tara:strand:+ start:936 stop:1295 length:360 start_codon:yes stop_codon:yes gene_type:complete
MNIEEILKADPSLKRHQDENRQGYTNMEITKKKEMIDDLEKKYPHLPAAWLGMLFDWLHGKDDKELEDMVNKHKITPPKERAAPTGSITVERREDREPELEANRLLNEFRQLAVDQELN